MLTYEKLKKSTRQFVSLTSLTPEEFEYIQPVFEKAHRQAFPGTQTKRVRNANANLAEVEKVLWRAWNKNAVYLSVPKELSGDCSIIDKLFSSGREVPFFGEI